MLRLVTLGTTEIVDSADGAQPIPLEAKRLALLAYVALAHGGRSVPRDALLPVFWPEHGEQDARNALRQALHYLTRKLGPLLEGRGTNELAVDESRLDADVLEFERALDANEPARAMRIYRGELLPGFSFRSASDPFLEWVDRERNRLTQRALEAAIELAEEEGRRANVTGEIHWLRRALVLEPFREDLLERIVDLHERHGNRATAAQTIRSFSRELRLRYGVPLSPRLRQRLHALQDGRPDRVATRAQPHDFDSLRVRFASEVARTNDLIRQLQALTGRQPLPDADWPAPTRGVS